MYDYINMHANQHASLLGVIGT